MLPTTNSQLPPQSTAAPSALPPSAFPLPTLAAALSPEDRTKLSTLFRTRGDAVSFAHLREEDPLDTLLWLDQPHIKPWHDAIRNAHRDHEATETHLSLARALRDITRILDLEADSTLRIRAVNAIIKLANAIHRGRATTRATDHRSGWSVSSASPPTSEESQGSASALTAALPNPPHGVREADDLHRAHAQAQTAKHQLEIHRRRTLDRTLDLAEANAPVGDRTWATSTSSALQDQAQRPHPIAPLISLAKLNGHATGHLTAKAGTPRPPTPPRRRQRRR